MIKIYLDTNILLDLLFTERPFSKQTKEFLFEFKECKFVVNSNALKDIFYIATTTYKKSSEALNFIQTIDNKQSMLWEVVNSDFSTRNKAYKYCNKHLNSDLEDVLQYFTAFDNKCKFIVTNDKNFPKLDIALIRTDPKQKNYEPK